MRENFNPPPDTTLAYLASCPEAGAKALAILREIILKTAAEDPSIGMPLETMKWGEIAFLPRRGTSGTTLRIAWRKKDPDRIGLFFHCGTSLADQIHGLLIPGIGLEGRRGVLFPLAKSLPEPLVGMLAAAVLTYRR